MKAGSGPPRRQMLRLGLGLAASFCASHEAAAQLVGRRAKPASVVQLTSTPLGMSNPSLANAAMMVAGPADAVTGSWAGLLTGPLSAALHPGASLSVVTLGGRDGVTGANAFEALSNPDGSTALLVPGTAASAWLAGDPRVHFDAGRWIPALTSFGSAILVGRSTSPALLRRIAASNPSGVEVAALLGLSLLGGSPVPVFGLADPDDARAALLDGRVDAIMLTGRDVPARCHAICDGGDVRPVFSFGAEAEFAGVPTMPELYRRGFGQQPSGILFEAWKATAASARLDAAVVLQPLTPAALVAQWRLACAAAIANPLLADAAGTAQLDLLPAPGCVGALSAIVADENTLLALRRWIASRPGWLPA